MKLTAAIAGAALALQVDGAPPQVDGAPPPAVARAYERLAQRRPDIIDYASKNTKHGRLELLRYQAIFAPALSRTETKVFETILLHYNFERRDAFPGYALIAELSKCSRRTAIRSVRVLKDTGFLDVEHRFRIEDRWKDPYRHDRTNVYRFVEGAPREASVRDGGADKANRDGPTATGAGASTAPSSPGPTVTTAPPRPTAPSSAPPSPARPNAEPAPRPTTPSTPPPTRDPYWDIFEAAFVLEHHAAYGKDSTPGTVHQEQIRTKASGVLHDLASECVAWARNLEHGLDLAHLPVAEDLARRLARTWIRQPGRDNRHRDRGHPLGWMCGDKAIAKDGKHRMLAWFPSTGGEWLAFDSDSRPFTLRNGQGYRAPAPAVTQPAADVPPPVPASAPAAQDGVLGALTEVLRELRAARVAPLSAAPPNDSTLVAMIQANAQIMQTVLTVVGQRPAETAARPAEPTALALQLIGAVQKLVPAPIAQPGLAEQIPLIKALRDLSQPAAPANELQPFVDIFGQVMAADAARTQAEVARAQTSSRPSQEPPAARPPMRPRPPLVHVPGIGMVEVVAPDAGTRFGDMSTEERAAMIRKDPALLRELGIELPPPPASPAAPVRPAVVASVPASPAVPDLEPPPVPVAATSPASSTTVSSAPSVVATAPPEPAPAIAASPATPATPAAPPIATGPVEPPPDAPAEERQAIALPAQMPVAEPPHVTDAERQRAVGELKRLTTLSHDERVAALRKLPGIGAMAEDVARAMASLPPAAVAAMAQTLDLAALGALAGRTNGVAGG